MTVFFKITRARMRNIELFWLINILPKAFWPQLQILDTWQSIYRNNYIKTI